MLQRNKLPKGRTKDSKDSKLLPDIKSSSQFSPTSNKMTKPSPKLSSSRISRQSCSIETTISNTDTFRKKPSNGDSVVRNKSYFNHRQLMNDYLKRMSVSVATRVFSMNSQDEHIRRFLVKNGWVENHNISPMYDLRWVYNDNPEEFKNLLDGQFYNHFKNTKELTTKSALLVNLKNQSEIDASQFFPRAYDLTNATEKEDFLRDHERTCIQIILKNIIGYIKQNRKQNYINLKSELQKEWKTKAEIKQVRRNKIELIRQINRKYKNIYVPGQLTADQQTDFKLDLQLICDLLSKLSDMKRQIKDGFYDDKNFELSGNYLLKQRIRFMNYSQVRVFNNGQSPNQFLIKKLIGYHLILKQEPSYKNDGVHNIWIVKPSGSARGQGIFLETNIGEVLNQSQPRLIQKYIERPLTYNGIKFDLRQWVLVKSFQPLQAYVFSHSYMRMCSQEYDLSDTKNLLRHLTNFSLNKTAFQDQSESIYSSDFLQEWLQQKGIDYSAIRQSINDVILKTLRIAAPLYEDESRYCFELYGFDIMLDDKYKPWLLEVNLSPACAERVAWLSDMLDQMTQSMMAIIFGGFEQPTKYYFELLVNEDIPNVQYNQEALMEINGYKCNYRREKMIDKKYYEYLACITIQKFQRMFIAKAKLRKLRREKYAIIIQKYARVRFARKVLRNLKLNWCATVIQCRVRSRQAIARRKYLFKAKMATKIQCCVRSYQSRKYLAFLRLEHQSLMLQSLFRIIQAKQIAKKLKNNLKSYKFIQRKWKQKFNLLTKKAITIQKCIKMIQQRKRYTHLLKQVQAAIQLQSKFRQIQAKNMLRFLKLENSAMMLQCLFRCRLKKRQIHFEQTGGFLKKLCHAYNKARQRQALVHIWNSGVKRNQAIMRIQSYRQVIKCKRYLKRLKRLKKLIRLQATIKMHIQRKRFRRLLTRKRAIMKIIRAIKIFLFYKSIIKRIQYKKMKKNSTSKQIQQQKPQPQRRPMPPRKK